MAEWWCSSGYKAEKWAPFTRMGRPVHWPMRWCKPRAVLVCDPSGLTHAELGMLLAVMSVCPQHLFVVMTKHVEAVRELFGGAEAVEEQEGQDIHLLVKSLLPNVQLGVPVSTQTEADERIPHLLATPAAHRFVYVTPREPISFEWSRDCGAGRDHGNWLSGFRHDGVLGWAICERIDRVIVGGGKELVHPDWVRGIRDQCAAAGVSFYFDA